MPESIVGLFAEDEGHAAFAGALIRRIGREEGRVLEIRLVSGKGGHGRALDEFRLYQRTVIRSVAAEPDLAVVVIDANCKGWNEARREIGAAVESGFRPPVIVASPDPHVERWYLADPESFHEVVGVSVPRERVKCERDRYKNRLREAIRGGGHIPTLGGVEFAAEIVEVMNLYRAGRGEPSLRAFVNDMRDAVRRLPS